MHYTTIVIHFVPLALAARQQRYRVNEETLSNMRLNEIISFGLYKVPTTSIALPIHEHMHIYIHVQ